MTPAAFIQKWHGVALTERAAAQTHFIDLCRLLDEPDPISADPTGQNYSFERGVKKAGHGGDGWADVWKRGCFAWEYKKRRGDLNAALRQLLLYASNLENPPLLITSDTDTIKVRTAWTNMVVREHTILLDDLADAGKRQLLKWVFTDPDKLRPDKSRAQATKEMADAFSDLADRLFARHTDPHAVARFIDRFVFCLFASDVGLLPPGLMTRLLTEAERRPSDFVDLCGQLFKAMAKSGGRVGFDRVAWFNGDLFADDSAPELQKEEIQILSRAAGANWSAIDPAIFGTLFERFLNPEKRGQIGAYYTDPSQIMQILDPVLIRPLHDEWEAVRTKIEEHMERAHARSGRPAATARRAAEACLSAFIERLRGFRVLDPACGSGNFLYLALHALKDIEKRAWIEAEALGLPRRLEVVVGPRNMLGIEKDEYAVDLARLSVWIGELQWMLRNGFDAERDPILKSLDTIECRDALLDLNGAEAKWPVAGVIVGNPPFLGSQELLRGLGDQYAGTLRRTFSDRVPGTADLVCYWFEKARQQISDGSSLRAGLVATQSIRRGGSRGVLDRVCRDMRIFNAWSDQEWIVDSAAVRVSLVCFGPLASPLPFSLDGKPTTQINPDLTGSSFDLLTARPLTSNRRLCFQGPVRVGQFDVPETLAQAWLLQPINPNGRPNADVLRPLLNASDVVGRPRRRWLIDFGGRDQQSSALYAEPFAHVLQKVMPVRSLNRDQQRRERWWQLGRSGTEVRSAVAGLSRIIVTPRVSKYRIFVWCHPSIFPDTRLNVIARDDDCSFGVLHSKYHEAWALRLGGMHGKGNDPQYTPSTGFETFPFPDGLALDVLASDYAADPRAQAIAAAAHDLNAKREAWLNPPDLIRIEPEVVPGYPNRILPKDDQAAKLLAKRTLTTLYNERPQWLRDAHAALDTAVSVAYGWPSNLSDDELLERLLALNLTRTALCGAATGSGNGIKIG
jgi:hypothetical protein